MQQGEIQESFIPQDANTRLKQVSVTAILAPSQMPLIDLAPVHFVSLDLEFVPLDPRVEHVQDVVKDFVPTQSCLGSTTSSRQTGSHILVKMSQSNLHWKFLNSSFIASLVVHNNV